MNEYAIFERGVVGLIVLASAWTALSKLAPEWRRWLTGQKAATKGEASCGACRGCEQGDGPAKV